MRKSSRWRRFVMNRFREKRVWKIIINFENCIKMSKWTELESVLKASLISQHAASSEEICWNFTSFHLSSTFISKVIFLLHKLKKCLKITWKVSFYNIASETSYFLMFEFSCQKSTLQSYPFLAQNFKFLGICKKNILARKFKFKFKN